jgi:hypothetical protein
MVLGPWPFMASREANVCRKVCGVTPLIPAVAQALRNAFQREPCLKTTSPVAPPLQLVQRRAHDGVQRHRSRAPVLGVGRLDRQGPARQIDVLPSKLKHLGLEAVINFDQTPAGLIAIVLRETCLHTHASNQTTHRLSQKSSKRQLSRAYLLR